MKAIQTFATRTQRFRAGQDVPAGTDLTPHTEEGLRAAGVIGEAAEPGRSERKPASTLPDGPRRKPSRPRRKSKTEN